MDSHSFSKPRPVPSKEVCSTESNILLPCWDVDVLRNGVDEPVACLRINADNFPPRKRNNKIVWKLPDTVDSEPRFGIHERKRLWELFKQQKKIRRKKKGNGNNNNGNSSTTTTNDRSHEHGPEYEPEQPPPKDNDNPVDGGGGGIYDNSSEVSLEENTKQLRSQESSKSFVAEESHPVVSDHDPEKEQVEELPDPDTQQTNPTPPPQQQQQQQQEIPPPPPPPPPPGFGGPGKSQPPNEIEKGGDTVVPSAGVKSYAVSGGETAAAAAAAAATIPPSPAASASLIDVSHRFFKVPRGHPLASLATAVATVFTNSANAASTTLPVVDASMPPMDLWLSYYSPIAQSSLLMGTALAVCQTVDDRRRQWISLTSAIPGQIWECQGCTCHDLNIARTTSGATAPAKASEGQGYLVVLTGRTVQPTGCLCFTLSLVLVKVEEGIASDSRVANNNNINDLPPGFLGPVNSYQIANDILTLSMINPA